MLGWLRDSIATRKQRRITLRVLLNLYETGAANLMPPDDPDLVRRLSNRRLHEWLPLSKGDARITLERELRRREAWDAPAGRAFWISLLALALSAGAIALNLMK